jgi:hypothetical protein
MTVEVGLAAGLLIRTKLSTHFSKPNLDRGQKPFRIISCSYTTPIGYNYFSEQNFIFVSNLLKRQF